MSAWIGSAHTSPFLVRMGEFSYHLCQSVPSQLLVRPTGVHVIENLRTRMEFT